MIHFDFYLEDAEAENLFDCVDDCIYRLLVEKLSAKNITYRNQLEKTMSHFEDLKKKMTNTKVESKQEELERPKASDANPVTYYHVETQPGNEQSTTSTSSSSSSLDKDED